MFHASAKHIRRSDGRSATAAAAYRAAERIEDIRYGEVFDYRRKRHVLAKGLVTPNGENPPQDRSSLWNMAEMRETRSNATTAVEWQISLPIALSESENIACAQELAKNIAIVNKTVADWTFHKPHSKPVFEEGGMKVANPHVHILLPTREWRSGQLTQKCDSEVSSSDRKKRGILTSKKDDLIAIRAMIADVINFHLQKAGLDIRVDHRSFADQGVALEPLEHLSRAEVAAEHAGVTTAKGERNRERLADRKLLAQMLKTAAEIKALESAIAQTAGAQVENQNDTEFSDACHFGSTKVEGEQEDEVTETCRTTP